MNYIKITHPVVKMFAIYQGDSGADRGMGAVVYIKISISRQRRFVTSLIHAHFIEFKAAKVP